MSDNTNHCVSVLIPCYNAGRWVTHAVETALAQTYKNKEVIVVDDGSTDESLAAIKAFGDRIRWESGPNRGASAARNRLLDLSRGDWIQYLDADDYLRPEKITRQMKVVAETGCQLVVSPWLRENGEIELEPTSADPWANLLATRLGNTIANLWHKRSVIQAGAWDTAMSLGEENDLMLRMLMQGVRVSFCMPPLAVVRSVNSQSASVRFRGGELQVRATRLRKAVRFLEETNQLNNERRRAAGLAFLSLASALHRRRDRRWRQMERAAYSVDPELRNCLRDSRIYGTLYRMLGFQWAELYSSCRRYLQFG